MRVKLHRKKDTVLGSFTVKVSYVKTWNFYGSSLLFSTITFMILPFWIIRAWEIYIRFTERTDCLPEQANEICLFQKSSGQNVFHEEIFFCGKRIYIPTFSSHYSLLFKQCFLVFLFFFLEEVGVLSSWFSYNSLQ